MAKNRLGGVVIGYGVVQLEKACSCVIGLKQAEQIDGVSAVVAEDRIPPGEYRRAGKTTNYRQTNHHYLHLRRDACLRPVTSKEKPEC